MPIICHYADHRQYNLLGVMGLLGTYSILMMNIKYCRMLWCLYAILSVGSIFDKGWRVWPWPSLFESLFGLIFATGDSWQFGFLWQILFLYRFIRIRNTHTHTSTHTHTHTQTHRHTHTHTHTHTNTHTHVRIPSIHFRQNILVIKCPSKQV